MHATKLTSMERGFRFSDRNREREKIREKRSSSDQREREKRKGEDFFFLCVLCCVGLCVENGMKERKRRGSGSL